MGFFEYATLGFCWWDIPALILFIAAAALFFVRRHKLGKEIKELQDQLSEKQ
jgi:hypothetical protein